MSSQSRELTCPVCGHCFNPNDHLKCQECPFHQGCMLTCCPACGYDMPDPERSSILKLMKKIRRPRKKSATHPITQQDIALQSLYTVKPGTIVEISETNTLQTQQLEQLQAYGITAGAHVEVIQQSPVTVVRVEHLNLAFEAEIAQAVFVKSITFTEQKNQQ